ncbi:adenosylcobinamide-GDP ribazoletransferase [Aquibium sp. A9E412]|uniref:adenosylcobinamide-GDP ribazoletransferase n=1 Tax=Aquibium sp. A9E412 TaxID=2976767 RepID=UPI0025B25E7A|nr:adenosylcobinamide-GDP ribazoletransferase [Aquibium sp. A9E412]MDN2565842.1 adenosylcobinamide-GDP ribazoletransferase [Aquibium sp. A9E412]
MRERDRMAELVACLGFYTRLPVAARALPPGGFAAAQWAAPLAGAAVGLAGTLAWLAATRLGLGAWPAALAALAATMLASGALHEDGLADVADGFGGGATPADKLAIMRDSRIGSYGVLALILSVLMRAAALAALAAAGAAAVTAALLAAHMAARAAMPAFLRAVPPARRDGLSTGLGAVPRGAALTAAALGGLALLPLGLGAALATAAALGLAGWLFARLCRRQIGGHTGDCLGALEQGGEALVLLAAVAAFT